MHPQNTQREESCNQVPWGVCAFSGWGTWEPVCVLPWRLPSGEGVCLGGVCSHLHLGDDVCV